MKRIILIVMALMMLVGTAIAEEAAEYRTDVTEEEFLGTWKLKYMIVEGYDVPTQDLGLEATIVLTSGEIEITDIMGIKKTYETVFEDGHLVYVDDKGMKMLVYITPEGLLHIDEETETFEGTIEDEGSPISKSGMMDLTSLNNSIMSQFFEKAE